MTTLTEITNKIESLNSTHFQEMCDEIMFRRYPRYKSLSRSGMAKSVDETKVGTPDSYILLENDKFIFNEHTKDKKRGFSKLKGDFNSCVNENKIDITVGLIQEINFCISFTITKNQTLELSKLCSGKGIIMGLWDIDRLAKNILYENPDLANQYLQIPLDKSQWVILKTFVSNYNKAGKSIATPLDNPFYFRKSEIEELKNSIVENYLTVISGSPGVGKSKLVVEVLENLKRENENLIIWVNSFDSSTLIDDLSLKLPTKNDVILFIDDVNRISHFYQILKYLKNSHHKNVKLIVTVRDYALQEFTQVIYEYDYNVIEVNKLKDEQVKEILENPPFNINTQKIKQKIVFLGQGNLRLMMMLARLDITSQDIEALNDTADAFDFYFRTFLDDANWLGQPEFVKTMAIVSFFNTLKLSDEVLLDEISTSFDISSDILNNCINDLVKWELLSLLNKEVKVSEQNLGFYLFDKAFFKDDILNFQKLLEDFYPKYRSRFKECVISSNNNFGHKNLVSKITTDLLSYLRKVELNLEESILFYDLFWFAIPDTTLTFIVEHSLLGDIEKEAQFNFKYETNDFAYKRDKFLSLVTHFFRDPTEYFLSAIKASLEYVKRHPEKASELAYIFENYLSFGYNDIQYNYYRQRELLNVLIYGFKENLKLEKELFYEISKTFLKHSFQNFEPTLDKNSISYYTYPQQSDSVIKTMRKEIWHTVEDNFYEYPKLTLALLNSCASQFPDNNKELMLFDFDFILKIINDRLVPKSFTHCKYVHKQIWWFKRCGIDNNSFPDILDRFNCKLFQFYRAINIEYLYGKKRWESDLGSNHNKYNKEKEIEIETYLEHNYKNAVVKFCDDYKDVLSHIDSKWKISDMSLDVSINFFFQRSKKNVVSFIDKIVNDNNGIGYIPYRSFQLYSNDFSTSVLIYEHISNQNFKHRIIWLSQLFELTKDTKSLEFFVSKIAAWAKAIDEHCNISFYNLEKYLKYDENIFKDIVPILSDKIEEGYRLYSTRGFSGTMINSMKGELDSLKKLYCLLDNTSNHFDFQSHTFRKICELQPSFLFEYFEYLYSISERERSSRRLRDRFDFIWTSPNLILELDKVLNLIIEKEYYYGITEHNAGILFKNLKSESKMIALKCLRKYMLENSFSIKRLNAVMDIVNKNFPNEASRFITLHLIKNKRLDIFKDVKWTVSQGVWSGNTNTDLVRASRWEKVLNVVNEMKDDIDLVPIKSYLKETVAWYRHNAK